jgi:hypothetical protein
MDAVNAVSKHQRGYDWLPSLDHRPSLTFRHPVKQLGRLLS